MQQPGSLPQSDPARTARCDTYAHRQVQSRAPDAVGGAARGALGGALVGGLIDGAEGAGTGAAVGAAAGALGGGATAPQGAAYRKFFDACMRTR